MDRQSSSVKKMKGLYCFILLSMMSLCDASSMRKPLKTIKSPDGDIIDCIRISHQPAFDHPLLKNHTILMRPSYYPAGKGLRGESDTETITQLWQLNGKCPEGTIPIRRNQNKSNFKTYEKHRSFPQIFLDDRKLDVGTGHEHAVAYVVNNKFYGAKAIINLWRPQVQNRTEFSLSQLWIMGGPNYSIVDTIEVGWMVYPHIFGDSETRLFVFWTNDGYQNTRCYNLQCRPGFVQTTNRMAVGGTISPVSTYHGAQSEIDLLVWKDPTQNVWWLKYGNEVIGYWPASLFTYLADSASIIEWGGEVFANPAVDGQHTTTQMGSGHFPEEKFGGSSYFKNLQVVDESNNLRPPNDIKATAEKPNCYNIALAKSDDWGDFFYYGGPGRNVNCP